jgi:hypothetical protein
MLKQTVVAVLLLTPTMTGQPPPPGKIPGRPVIRAQCMAAFGHTAFCACIAEFLPADVPFTQYVVVVNVPDATYRALPPTPKLAVDATRAARDRCIATVTP